MNLENNITNKLAWLAFEYLKKPSANCSVVIPTLSKDELITDLSKSPELSCNMLMDYSNCLTLKFKNQLLEVIVLNEELFIKYMTSRRSLTNGELKFCIKAILNKYPHLFSLLNRYNKGLKTEKDIQKFLENLGIKKECKQYISLFLLEHLE